MGRASTRENKNIYQTTREALHLTREAAGELLSLFRPSASRRSRTSGPCPTRTRC